MIQLDNMTELRAIQSDTRLKVIFPMKALTVKEIHNIYCPHCGQSVFGFIPESRWEIGTCSHCGGKFYIYN